MIRKRGSVYHYEFWKDGKRSYGVCHGCTTLKDAQAFAKKMKAVVQEAAAQKNVRALVENFRDQLTGGQKILLKDAYELSLNKPRTRQASVKVVEQKREAFRDFTDFMEARYPDIKDLAAVLPCHAEEYIQLVRTSGRFNKELIYSRGGRQITRQARSIPSPRTANLYQTTCHEVFKLLARDAGLMDNPFDMPRMPKQEETREAFTAEELNLIHNNLDDFTRPLFTVAILTALREGDICTLKWDEVDLANRAIKRKMNKTGRMVEIPISEELLLFLNQQREKSEDAEFVFPEHAAMYQKNPTGVSYRVKQFLEGLGIKTTRIPQGRTQAVSVKDLHSCRHTFCYYAGLKNIPLPVVQSIVGHMTSEMTRHYSAHATMMDKREGIEALSGLFVSEDKMLPAADPVREQLLVRIQTLSTEDLKKVVAIIDSGLDK